MKSYFFLVFLLFQSVFVFAQGKDYEPLFTLRGHLGGAQNVRFSPNGKILASGGYSDGRVILWDTSTGQILKTLTGHQAGVLVCEVTFSFDGKYIASAGSDGLANVWEVASGRQMSSHKVLTNPFVGGEAFAAFVVFSGNNRHIYFGGRNYYVMKAEVGSASPAEPIYFVGDQQTGRPRGQMTGGVISGDKKYLVYTAGTFVEYVNLQTNQLEKFAPYSGQYLNDVVVGPFANSVATWSQDGRATFWSNATLKPLSSYQVAEEGEYSGLSFSKDNKYMVTSASGTIAKVWDLSNGKLVQILKGHTDLIRISRFSPVDDLIATASYDGSVIIWNKKTEEEITPNPPVDEPEELKVVYVRDTVRVKDTVVIREVVRDTIRITDNTNNNQKVVFEDEEVKVGEAINLKKIQFKQSRYELLDESLPELEKLISFMNKYPKMEIELSGHTDNVGDPKKNYDLSVNRVKVTKQYLVNKGIDEKRISIKAYGGTMPIDRRASEEGRRKNRRVEMKILKM